MKKIIYLSILLLVVFSCSEDDLIPKIETIKNYYVITNDNPNDPVSVKRFELYEKYGVPVYFNDTVAKVFVDISYKGDSVFRYERVDMNWKFSENNTPSFRYVYTYYTTPQEKLQALSVAEQYLVNASIPLRPFCMLLTKTAAKINIRTESNELSANYEIGYRAILMQNLASYSTEVLIKEFISLLKKQMVSSKLNNFTKELETFMSISNSDWYGKDWRTPVEQGGLGVQWDSSHVMSYYGGAPFEQEKERILLTAMRLNYMYFERDYPKETPESIESLRQNVREKIAPFGFVGYGGNSLSSYTINEELSVFLTEILSINRELFIKRWGNSPLVMAKYEILYKIINEKLGVEL